jgi:broad specificity phosphatase PhoE
MANSEERVVAYFCRHGSTILNENNCFRGAMDVPLDAKGHHDAEELADFFSSIKLGDSFSSDRKRAADTAETILRGKTSVARRHEGLRAWDVGYLSGESKDDPMMKASLGYHQDNPNEQIPQGESLNQFRGRVRPHILKAIHAGWKSNNPSLVATHSSVIHELGNVVHQDHTAALVKPGGVAAVSFDGKSFSAKAIFKAADKKNHGYGT